MKALLTKKSGIVVSILFAVLVTATSPVIAAVGFSDNGLLNEEWRDDFDVYFWGYFGASPAIADLWVNTQGSEPNADLEIVSGSDDMAPSSFPGFLGVWRCFDSQGNLEWATDTQSDEARGDPVIVDLDGDGYLEIVTGTTSGETIEVLDRFGNFFWTFPDPPQSGNFMWDGGPAVADVDPAVSGLEVIASNRARYEIYCLDGDNSDGVDDGYTWPGGYPWFGNEGVDWDILWIFTVPIACEIYATPAIDDVDNDGQLEVAFGATNGVFYVLDAQSGALETSFSLSGAIYASAAVCNLDSDPYLEMVIGSTSGDVYALQWDGTTAGTEWTYATSGAVFSSAAIGDIDDDGSPEAVVGSNDNNIYALDASGALEWSYPTGGAIYSSPSLANRGVGTGLGIYVGSEDTYLYLLDGTGGLIDRFETYSGSCGGSLMSQGIHTSPSIADVDGDGKLEIFFYDWGCGSAYGGNTFWAVEDSCSRVAPYSIEWANFRSDSQRRGCCEAISVPVDIKPTSCPNPLNVWSKGVLPVAVLGSENFDVDMINADTIRLAGVPSIRSSYEDVAAPVDRGECECECSTEGPDGYLDLTFKFRTQDIVGALGDVVNGETLMVALTGELSDGTPIEGADCIRVRVRKARKRSARKMK
jgi:hypothetical protein